MMKTARVPVDLRAVGYRERDVDALVGGTIVQARLLDNAPRRATRQDLAAVFRDALDARPVR